MTEKTQNDNSRLVIDLRPGESISMSGEGVIEMIHKSGQVARIRISAPRDVKVEKIGVENVKN